ncbi:unnamed protein product [Rotaria sp. Silwood2]|nr:unnamed protein product [Rotaria sp. Silwood2]
MGSLLSVPRSNDTVRIRTVSFDLGMEEFNVKNCLFSSSTTVYGTPKYLPLDEKHPCIGDAITNPYG